MHEAAVSDYPFLNRLIGLGSVLAGVWSAGRIELGILPLGAYGFAVSSMLLFTVRGSIIDVDAHWTAGFISASLFPFLPGTSAGMFDVPLAAYLQDRSPPARRGSILAALNFVTFSGILDVAILFWILRMSVQVKLWWAAREIFLLCGGITLPVVIYIVWLIPQSSFRFVVWLSSKTINSIRVHGVHRIPSEGGALLVPNHVSWLDGDLLLLISGRPIRMVVHAGNFRGAILKRLGDLWQVILLPNRPKALARTLRAARTLLEESHLVCIFPEGRITRTGKMQAFKREAMKIHEGTEVPLIPVYLDELWGSIFSFQGGRFFWKWPRRWPYPISIHID